MKRSIHIVVLLSAVTALLSCGKEKCSENRKAGCVCTMQYDPVCGCNKKTYGNGCEAECSGITEYTKGECN